MSKNNKKEKSKEFDTKSRLFENYCQRVDGIRVNNPNEIIYFPRIKDLLSPRYFRNLAAHLIIKLFNFF